MNNILVLARFYVASNFLTVHGALSNSMCGFALCLAKIEVGIAYAVWSALGTAIVTTIGIVLFGESCDSVKLGCLLLIMVGVVGLNLRESH